MLKLEVDESGAAGAGARRGLRASEGGLEQMLELKADDCSSGAEITGGVRRVALGCRQWHWSEHTRRTERSGAWPFT